MPSETTTYNVAKLQRILFSVWGVKPVVKCSCPGGWGADCEEAPLQSVRPRAQMLLSAALHFCTASSARDFTSGKTSAEGLRRQI